MRKYRLRKVNGTDYYNGFYPSIGYTDTEHACKTYVECIFIVDVISIFCKDAHLSRTRTLGVHLSCLGSRYRQRLHTTFKDFRSTRRKFSIDGEEYFSTRDDEYQPGRCFDRAMAATGLKFLEIQPFSVRVGRKFATVGPDGIRTGQFITIPGPFLRGVVDCINSRS